jgi:hypothetical protein
MITAAFQKDLQVPESQELWDEKAPPHVALTTVFAQFSIVVWSLVAGQTRSTTLVLLPHLGSIPSSCSQQEKCPNQDELHRWSKFDCDFVLRISFERYAAIRDCRADSSFNWMTRLRSSLQSPMISQQARHKYDPDVQVVDLASSVPNWLKS